MTVGPISRQLYGACVRYGNGFCLRVAWFVTKRFSKICGRHSLVRVPSENICHHATVVPRRVHPRLSENSNLVRVFLNKQLSRVFCIHDFRDINSG